MHSIPLAGLLRQQKHFSFFTGEVFVLSGEEIYVLQNCNTSTLSISSQPENTHSWHRCSSANGNAIHASNSLSRTDIIPKWRGCRKHAHNCPRGCRSIIVCSRRTCSNRRYQESIEYSCTSFNDRWPGCTSGYRCF